MGQRFTAGRSDRAAGLARGEHAGAATLPGGAGAVLGRVPAWAWLTLLWAVLILPTYDFIAFYDEEGRRALLARDVLLGNSFTPEALGIRYRSKPPLMAWLMAGTATLTGRMDELAVRLPSMLANLACAQLVLWFTARATRPTFAFFAAAVFLLAPLAYSTATRGVADALVTATCFGAFVLWFCRLEQGRLSLPAWLGCAALLTVGSMAKGPPLPLGYFGGGVLLFTVLHGRWRDLPGLLLAAALPACVFVAWFVPMREPGDTLKLISEWRLLQRPDELPLYLRRKRGLLLQVFHLVPAVALVMPALVPGLRRAIGLAGERPTALLCYILVGPIFLLLWPATVSRYFVEVAPAAAVLAGLAAQHLWDRKGWLGRALVAAGAAAVAHAFLTGAYLQPLRHEPSLLSRLRPLPASEYQVSRRSGAMLDGILSRAPGEAYFLGGPEPHDYNPLAYVTRPIQAIGRGRLARLSGPAWLIVQDEDMTQALELRPGLAALPRESVGIQSGRTLFVFRFEAPDR